MANKIEQSFYSVYSYSRIKSIELALSHLPTPPPLFIILSSSYSFPNTTLPPPPPPCLCSLIYLQILLFICLYSIQKTDHQTFDEGMGWVGKRSSVCLCSVALFVIFWPRNLSCLIFSLIFMFIRAVCTLNQLNMHAIKICSIKFLVRTLKDHIVFPLTVYEQQT